MTLEYVQAALISLDRPASRTELLAILASWGHSTTRKSLNAVVSFLDERGMIAEGSKGIIHVPAASPALKEAIRKGTKF